MGKYIHLFDKIKDFEKEYWGKDYKNPWVSYTEENEQLSFGPRDEEEVKWKEPLTFKILSDGTVGWKYVAPTTYESNNSPKTIEYSINDKPWRSITSTTSGVTFNVNKGDLVRFRGDNSVYGFYSISINTDGISNFQRYWANHFTSTCDFDVYGNITSLLNSQNYKVTTLTESGTFSSLFRDCTKLKDASKLLLNSTTLSESCYSLMFYKCTGLTAAPELPATTIPRYAYKGMFYNCTSLTTQPELLATTLNESCYEYMFCRCTNLTTTYTLPAETIPGYGYFFMYAYSGITISPTMTTNTVGSYGCMGMFSNCTSLITASDLTATTINSHAYSNMFDRCSSLTTAPRILATTISNNGCDSMFYLCTNLVNPPTLPATQIGSGAYYEMFYGCYKLAYAPVLPSTTLSEGCYREMFYNCKSITTMPSLPATSLPTRCYEEMFYGCTNLTTIYPLNFTSCGTDCCYGMFMDCDSITEIPNNFFPQLNITLPANCFGRMFRDCDGLTSLPQGLLPYTLLGEGCYAQMFYMCDNLESVPSNLLPSTTLAVSCYDSMFYCCSKLTNLPELPATNLAAYCYKEMFYNCESITTIPANYLPATTVFNSCYGSMFRDCYNITNLPNLPATTLGPSCYKSMFSGCRKITSIPNNFLPAITLTSNCYQQMFSSCQALESIPGNLLPATTMATYCYYEMFYNCKSLTSLPSGLLPATTLSTYCYSGMFSYCNSLVSIPENLLPCTNLTGSEYCYANMFRNCSSLEIAPDLPATTLVSNCYNYMFQECFRLRYIKCLAQNNNVGTTGWLSGVPKEGVFLKAMNSTWTSGISGIPTSWLTCSEIHLDNHDYDYLINNQSTTINLSGYSNTNWTLTTSDNWITANVSSGSSGNINITISVSQNNSNTRTGTITLSGSSENIIMSIKQVGNAFTNITPLKEMRLEENEYVDVGVLNPTNIQIDSNSVGYLKVNLTPSSTRSSDLKLTLWKDDDENEQSTLLALPDVFNNGSKYVNGAYTYLTSYQRSSADPKDFYFYIDNLYSQDNQKFVATKFDDSYERSYSSFTMSPNTDYYRIGGSYGKYWSSNLNYKNLNCPIKSIAVNPHSGQYLETPLVLYPFINTVNNKKLFIDDNYERVFEVKTIQTE